MTQVITRMPLKREEGTSYSIYGPFHQVFSVQAEAGELVAYAEAATDISLRTVRFNVFHTNQTMPISPGKFMATVSVQPPGLSAMTMHVFLVDH